MMEFKYYQVDAFTDKIFGGNPACVVPLDSWLPDHLLQKIALENAVTETAFFILMGDKIQLRWFTPEIEMDLCGHATLATAHVLNQVLNIKANAYIFSTLSGELVVEENGGLYSMALPVRIAAPTPLPDQLRTSFSIVPLESYKARDWLLVYDSVESIKNIKVNRAEFDKLNMLTGGVIITAEGTECDFVSRYFCPQASILEDPVTGSSHCTLIPYWSKRLGRTEMTAMQLSERIGILQCTMLQDVVIVAGRAVTYSSGVIYIP